LRLIPGLQEQVAAEEVDEIAGIANVINVVRIVEYNSRARSGGSGEEVDEKVG
jgi:hypothetical protein